MVGVIALAAVSASQLAPITGATRNGQKQANGNPKSRASWPLPIPPTATRARRPKPQLGHLGKGAPAAGGHGPRGFSGLGRKAVELALPRLSSSRGRHNCSKCVKPCFCPALNSTGKSLAKSQSKRSFFVFLKKFYFFTKYKGPQCTSQQVCQLRFVFDARDH